MHVAAVEKTPGSYEHIDPDRGRQRAPRWSSRSSRARATVRSRAASSGIDARRGAGGQRALARPSRSSRTEGYHFEAADASFELLLRRQPERYEPLLRGSRASASSSRSARTARSSPRRRSRSGSMASATSTPPRGTARSTRSTRRSARRSPTATRSCRHRAHRLQGPHPRRAPRHRRRDSRAASIRPTANATWGTIGVSENIIEASWEALVDSLECLPAPSREQLPE